MHRHQLKCSKAHTNQSFGHTWETSNGVRASARSFQLHVHHRNYYIVIHRQLTHFHYTRFSTHPPIRCTGMPSGWGMAFQALKSHSSRVDRGAHLQQCCQYVHNTSSSNVPSIAVAGTLLKRPPVVGEWMPSTECQKIPKAHSEMKSPTWSQAPWQET